jgi:GABA permease
MVGDPGKTSGAVSASMEATPPLEPREQEQDHPKLSRGLHQRHVTMIGFGGIIGAGLFVGSSAVIHQSGPAAVVSYLLAGIIVMLTMRMLGEMAVARPSTGSFVEYAGVTLGSWAGFTSGWLYWYFWLIVLAVEAVAGATILQSWIPGVPIWVFSLGLISILTATNLYSVRSYGEFEFWFASIKVSAIIVFSLIMLAALLGVIGGTGASASNLTGHGGFFAQGDVAVLSAVSAVMFAIIGGEIATIAAAESDQPSKAVARTTQMLAVRISIFYVVSILLIVMVLPWNSITVGKSPFAAALNQVGIAGSATIMNAIVLTAVCSALNSSIYIASRIMFVLSRNGDAPMAMEKLTRHGVPLRAIFAATAFGFGSVVVEAFSPSGVFQFLLNTSGTVVLLVYVMMAASQLILRRRLEATDPESLTLKMWLFPGLTIATIAAMLAVLVSMAFIESLRSQLFWSLASAAAVLLAYWARERVYARRPGRADIRPPDSLDIAGPSTQA